MPDRYLANKLKWVKEAIRGWRRVEFEKENKVLRELKYKVNDLELQAESRCLNEFELKERRSCKQRILELEKMAKIDLMQKAKIKCVREETRILPFFTRLLKPKTGGKTFMG